MLPPRPITREDRDVYLTDKDVKRLRKGYTVLKHPGGKHIAIQRNPHKRQTVRQIEKLKMKINELEGRKK